MKEMKLKPFAKIVTREQLKNIIPSYFKLPEFSDGENDDMFGVVLEVKFMDRVDNDNKLFMEYLFGNKVKTNQKGDKKWNDTQSVTYTEIISY